MAFKQSIEDAYDQRRDDLATEQDMEQFEKEQRIKKQIEDNNKKAIEKLRLPFAERLIG